MQERQVLVLRNLPPSCVLKRYSTARLTFRAEVAGRTTDVRSWHCLSRPQHGQSPRRGYLRIQTTTQKCTITLIGRTTGITAGHCLYVGGSGGWPGTYTGFGYSWFGIQTYGPTSGSVNTWTTAAMPWSIYVPDEWVRYSNDDYDYAIVEFGNSYPGDYTGWFGTFWGMNGSLNMYAYPGDKPTYSMWSEAGGWYGALLSSGQYKHYMDNAPGQSGACISLWTAGLMSYPNSGWAACSSINTGQALGSANYNVARKWDSTTYAAADLYGSWP